MSSSSAVEGSSQKDTATQEQWSRFLADAKIIPLSLVTLHKLQRCFGSAEVKPERPEKPYKRLRGKQTYKQSEKFRNRNKSMYARVSVGGQEIHDNGLQVLSGAVSINVLREALPFLDHALLVETNEGGGQYVEKIEMRYRGQSDDPNQDGLMEMKQLRESFESFPNDALIGFHLWVNPTDEGWYKLNLVLNKWDQEKVLALPEIDLEFFDVDGVPTLDLEKLGFRYS